MNIVILNTAGIPIYEQIKEQIKTAIYSGELVENELLPSIRQLAKDLRISVITTTRAYNDLEREGFLTSMQGKGFYVSPKNSELIREQTLRDIETHFTEAVKAAGNAGMEKDELLEIFDLIYLQEKGERKALPTVE